MIRTIINIDKWKCNGCGLCVNACHEGAIALKDGKAELIRDDYCDGLGNCLPVCPTGAITFIEREAAAFDEAAVQSKAAAHNQSASQIKATAHNQSESQSKFAPADSQLRQWPVQIKLVPINAPYFDNANLLIAADCTAFAYGDFHNRFMKNSITLIGCPKLDAVDYSEKLTAILTNNNIKSITVVRMEVPCCGGIQHAVVNALKNSGKIIPWQVVTISTDGKILE